MHPKHMDTCIPSICTYASQAYARMHPKVSTKGLSFKHVDVEGTKFVILDSEGSYAPVKVTPILTLCPYP